MQPNHILTASTWLIPQIHGKRLNGTASSTKLTKLSPNTRYHICVIGTGNWLSEPLANALQRLHYNESREDGYGNAMGMGMGMGNTGMGDLSLAAALPPLPDGYSPYQHLNEADMAELQQQQQEQQALIENSIAADNVLHEVLKNSHISACTDVQTLDSTPSLITDENGLSSNGFIHSILTRRLGLIVGCCLGIIVFIVMISVLSYVKLKKQRIENAKRQAAMPPEYISYRHFSIPNEELTRTNASSAAAVAAAAAASASASAAAAAAAAAAQQQQAGAAASHSNATTHTTMSSVPSGISAHISGTSLSTSLATTTTATTPIGGVSLPMAKSGSRSPIVGIGGLLVENGNALDANPGTGGAAGTVVAVAVSASPVNGGINTHGTLGHSHGHNHSHNHHSHNHAGAAHRANNNGGIAVAGGGGGGAAGGAGGGGAGYMAAGVVLNTNHLSVC